MIELGGIHVQESQNENTRETRLLRTRNRQPPDHMYRHGKNDRVGSDIRDLQSIVELGRVHAST